MKGRKQSDWALRLEEARCAKESRVGIEVDEWSKRQQRLAFNRGVKRDGRGSMSRGETTLVI